MVSILIFGAGGVGCVYGYILDKAGCEVTAVCRTNYEAVKAHGFTIRSALWGRVQYHPRAIRAVADVSTHPDYIVVCSKAFPGTASLIKEAIGPNTAIVLAQNGIAIEEEYAELYPNTTIISGVVYLPVTQVEPGVVEHGPLERFEIGTFPANASARAKAQTEEFSSFFTKAGANAPVFDDVQTMRWPKLAVNASLNPTTALTLCDDGNLLRSSDLADEMVLTIMRQVGKVASAAGYEITEEFIQEKINFHRARKETGGKEPSMLTDIRFERPIEVDAIVGNTVMIAKRHGVEVPHLELLFALAKARNFALVKGDEWKPILKID
jgi:2-dehydropantoate 2-reductase